MASDDDRDILSDRGEGGDAGVSSLAGSRRRPVPSKLTVSAVHQRLEAFQISVGEQLRQLRQLLEGGRPANVDPASGSQMTGSSGVPSQPSSAAQPSGHSIPVLQRTNQLSNGQEERQAVPVSTEQATPVDRPDGRVMTSDGDDDRPEVVAQRERERSLLSIAAQMAGVTSYRELESFAAAAAEEEDGVGGPVDLMSPNPFVGPSGNSPTTTARPGSAEEVVLFSLPQELQYWKLKGFVEDPQRVFQELHVALHFRFGSMQRTLRRNQQVLRLLKAAGVPMLAMAVLERVFSQAMVREMRELQLMMRRHQLYCAYIHGKEVAVVQMLQRQRDELSVFADRELAARYAEHEADALKSAIKLQQKRLAEKMLSQRGKPGFSEREEQHAGPGASSSSSSAAAAEPSGSKQSRPFWRRAKEGGANTSTTTSNNASGSGGNTGGGGGSSGSFLAPSGGTGSSTGQRA